MKYLNPFRSRLKLELMLCLLNGHKKLPELKSELSKRETSILHALKNLETLKLTPKTSGVYVLTPLGIVEASIVEESFSVLDMLERYRDSWLVSARVNMNNHGGLHGQLCASPIRA